MLKFKLVNQEDGNIEIPLDSETVGDALSESIDKLGYSLVSYEEEEATEDHYDLSHKHFF